MGAHLSTNGRAKAAPSCRSIGGKAVDSLSGERIDVVCPSDGQAFASIPASGKADVDRAVQAPRAAPSMTGRGAGCRRSSAAAA